MANAIRATVLAASTIFATAIEASAAYSKPVASVCNSEALPKKAIGLCNTSLFKSYVACVEATIPTWDPKGAVLVKEHLPVANSVLAVLVECEPIARTFGQRYGDEFANVLQSLANRIVSKRYAVSPLAEPSGDASTFRQYGQSIAPADVRRGDVRDDRTEGFRRPLEVEGTPDGRI